MRPRSSFSALVLALAVTACGKTTAVADTDMVMCLEPRCDNPDPNSCACPDDTDGIVSNTATDPTQDPETSTSRGETTTDADSSTTTSTETTSTGTTSTETTSTETTSTESSGSSDTSTGTDTTGTDSSSGSESSSGETG